MHIDHVTIRTNHLLEVRDFMVKVFDLTEGERPASIVAMVDGFWLYHQQFPMVHLIKSLPKFDRNSSDPAEAIDHFAFIMNDYDHFKQKLETLQIPFEINHIPELQRKRIFLRTPYGILIETIFEWIA
jgi:glyoxylase I family protein